jgi:UDP-glucose 4-epimerase
MFHQTFVRDKIMKNKILITGANGFIGSFLVEEALKQGFEVYAGIRKTSNRQYLQQKEVHFIDLLLSSPEVLEKQMREFLQTNGGFDYVIHNAGITQASKKEDFFTVNTQYTRNLIEAITASGMELKKFVLISSLAAYGPGNEQTFAPIQLTDSPHPISLYGQSKLQAQQYLYSLQDFPYIIINPTGVYGPRDKDFLQFIKLINNGIEPYVGTNRQMVSLIYVKDLARAVIGLLPTSIYNRSYFVSDGREYNKEQLGEAVRIILYKSTLKIKLPVFIIRVAIASVEAVYKIFGTLPFLNTEKVNEISSANWLCDSSKLWKDLGAEPAYYLEEGMRETIKWYKENNWL